jgi:hypothetical protein
MTDLLCLRENKLYDQNVPLPKNICQRSKRKILMTYPGKRARAAAARPHQNGSVKGACCGFFARAYCPEGWQRLGIGDRSDGVEARTAAAMAPGKRARVVAEIACSSGGDARKPV